MALPAVTSLLVDTARDFRRTWRQLAVAHVLSSTIAAVLLTPLATLVLQLCVTFSGRPALTDLDIVYSFVLKPIGIAGLVFGGTIALGNVAFELAMLVTIGYGSSNRGTIRWRDAFIHTLRHGLPILRLAALVVVRLFLVTAPFLAGGALVYVLLLTKYDINYYLSDKPPAFWAAVAVIGMLLSVMMTLVARRVVGWLLSIPILLFEGVSPRIALQRSWNLTSSNQAKLGFWLLGWILLTSAMFATGHGIVSLLVRFIIPQVTESLRLVALILGVLVLLGVLFNVFVTFLSVSLFSLFVARLYRAIGGIAESEAISLESADSSPQTSAWRVAGRTLVLGSGVAVLAAAIMGGLIMRGIQTEDRAQFTAHRGASASAPENTLAAFEQAIADGSDWVELDVQETADGEVVVIHDSDLKKVGGADLKIWDATREQLRGVDIGSRFDTRFRDERVPTLGDVLDLCKGRVGVNIELKYYGHQVRLEERVIEIVEAKGMASEIVVMSLDYEGIRKFRSLRPHWKMGLLGSVSMGNVTKLDVDFFAVNARKASPAFIDAAHRHGKQVLVWTVNDPVSMSVMISRGVDGVITDNPALGRSVLRQRAGLSSPERLLLELALMFGFEPKYGDQ